MISHLFTRVLPVPLPRSTEDPTTAPKGCFWATGAGHPTRFVRAETRAAIISSIRTLARHFVVATLGLPTTREADGVRLVTLAAMSAIADATARIAAANAPLSAAGAHLAGTAKGPTFPFGVDVYGLLRLELSHLLLLDPAVLCTRTQVLDYFYAQSLWLRIDHRLFDWSSTVAAGTANSAMGIGIGDRLFVQQLCLHTGLPSNGGGADGVGTTECGRMISGEAPELLDMFAEIGHLRDIFFYVKLLLSPTRAALPEPKPWHPSDATLTWSYPSDSRGFEVRAFGRLLRCASATPDSRPLVGAMAAASSSGGGAAARAAAAAEAVAAALASGLSFVQRLMRGQDPPRAPPSLADASALLRASGCLAKGDTEGDVRSEDEVSPGNRFKWCPIELEDTAGNASRRSEI
eukprot:scaffold43322_cov28-Tisochrysis_lutea.AAC.3